MPQTASQFREVMRRALALINSAILCFQKAPVELTADVTVPQTNTGGRGEDPKALERTLLKELAK